MVDDRSIRSRGRPPCDFWVDRSSTLSSQSRIAPSRTTTFSLLLSRIGAKSRLGNVLDRTREKARHQRRDTPRQLPHDRPRGLTEVLPCGLSFSSLVKGSVLRLAGAPPWLPFA